MFRQKKKLRAGKIDSVIGPQTEISGDLRFSGGLHVDGVIKGNVYADDDSGALLNVSEYGTVEGEVRVPNVVLNGTVIGDVHACDQLELKTNARITGNVYYRLIEMSMGAEVNGSLVHRGIDSDGPKLQLGHESTRQVAGDS
ncbi:MAG: cytoskeletal protein CcmA (bactofilin family) [Gammaproteobacteria bacterium]|jgi:cytoskeletal protein CcmA (bactofilin family)